MYNNFGRNNKKSFIFFMDEKFFINEEFIDNLASKW